MCDGSGLILSYHFDALLLVTLRRHRAKPRAISNIFEFAADRRFASRRPLPR